MTYISAEARKAWREDAAQYTAGDPDETMSAGSLTPDVVRFARRIVALLDQAEAPCGSCHPCTEWAAETWRQSGGKLPHKYQVDEAFAALDRVKAVCDEAERHADTYKRACVVTTGQVRDALTDEIERRALPLHRTEAGYPNCSTCDGGGCLDCTDPA